MGWRSAFRRLVAVACGVALLVVGPASVRARTLAREPSAPVWVGTWESAVATAAASRCVDCTIRDVVHTSVGGTALRVRLSNAFGTAPLLVAHTTVALPAVAGAQVAPGTLRQVRFHRSASVSIAPGAEAVSDPVRLRVPAAHDLFVTTYTPGYATPLSVHPIGLRRSLLASGTDAADALDAGVFSAVTHAGHLVSGVDVTGGGARGAIVALGDSITDGYRSTDGADHRWTDVLAARLARGRRPLAVLNAGIGGNRILLGGGSRGEPALQRLDRDVLSRPGVRTVIVLEGINDIHLPPRQRDPARITAGLATIVARAHARRLRVIGGTLTPFRGSVYYSPREELVRRAVNAWIRRSGTFDAVIDFDALVRDPADPRRLFPPYDSGDHLHPNDAGYAAIGNGVDLGAL
ncbi:SGNH/GDSL hydrolase family protein [Actinoallomurus sp. NBC_01490]|uniref:SGNH/GDSL hydrolase family protein n=1 Tax=Actinoallomurus sp. NBC_01490 TaxID=2903557 RepID=UPI002E3425D5|nr:SGNH/GDSL hydrolase family protein [Actinoallomurus sp. NBC_01490]